MASKMVLPIDTFATIDVSAPTRIDKGGTPFEVRDFRPSDVGDLLRFYEEFQPKRVAQGLPPAGPERIARWVAGVLSNAIQKIAWRDGKLIGHAFVTPTTEPGIGEYAVFLHQDERGRGIGTQLNQATADAARNRGLQGLWLTVEPHNRAAVKSYQKVGFRFVPKTAFSTEPEMELRF